MQSQQFATAHDAQPTPEPALAPVLAIIPARGGSKGVPRKNIRLLGGKPLIAYSIQVALASGAIDKVLVSTEDEEIAAIAKHFGAEVPFLRPAEIAGDTALIEETIAFCRRELSERGETFDRVVTLYPTHPFRTASMVGELVRLLRTGYSQVSTVKEVVQEHGYFYRDGDRLERLLDCGRPPEGQRYLRKLGLFFGRNYAMYNQRHDHYVHIVEDPISCIDIDTEQDLAYASEIVSRNFFDFQL